METVKGEGALTVCKGAKPARLRIKGGKPRPVAGRGIHSL